MKIHILHPTGKKGILAMGMDSSGPNNNQCLMDLRKSTAARADVHAYNRQDSTVCGTKGH